MISTENRVRQFVKLMVHVENRVKKYKIYSCTKYSKKVLMVYAENTIRKVFN